MVIIKQQAKKLAVLLFGGNMIRKFIDSDKQNFIDMCMDFYSGEGVDHSIPKEYPSATFDKLLNAYPFCEAYLYENNGIAYGYVLLAFTYSNESGGDVVWIEELYTVPEARGKGVASSLLKHVLNSYKHASRFRLEVTEDNKDAVRLYKKYGFKPLNYKQMEIIK